jgi:WD40 repeat protein
MADDGGSKRPQHIGSLDSQYVCQKLRGSWGEGKTLFFRQEGFRPLNKSAVLLCPGFAALVDRQSLLISIVSLQHGRDVAQVLDPSVSFASNISASDNGLFIVIDFEFGLTRCYRVFYARDEPTRLALVSDFTWSTRPLSGVSGSSGVIGTAVYQKVVIWELTIGTIHRIVDFTEEIRSLSVDDESGIWIVTDEKIYFVSMNGPVVAEATVHEKVTKIVSIPLRNSQPNRAAICGTESGNVFILEPKVLTGQIAAKKLSSEHQSPIDQIVISPSLKSFLTIDGDENCYVWTAIGMGGDPLRPSLFEACCLCCGEPNLICSSCNRAVCRQCVAGGTDTRCCLCLSMNVL